MEAIIPSQSKGDTTAGVLQPSLHRPLKNPIALLKEQTQFSDKIPFFIFSLCLPTPPPLLFPEKIKTDLILGGGCICVQGKHESITVYKMPLTPKRLEIPL